MGSGISRTGSAQSNRVGPQRQQRVRPASFKRTISSFLICGSSSSSSREMEHFPADLLVSPAEHGHRTGSKFPRKHSDSSLSSRNDLISIKTESMVSSGRVLPTNDNPSLSGNERKQLSENRELIPSHQSISNSRCNEIASTSYANEIGEGPNNSSTLHSLLDEVSIENNVSEENDFSNSDYSSFISDSPIDVHSSNRQLGFLVSEREQQNRQDRENLLHVDVVSISSSSVSPEINSREARRNSRRLFWDAFSRRDSRRRIHSRSFAFSPGGDYDHMRSNDRWLLDIGGGLLSGEIGEDSRSNSGRTQRVNEQRLSSRSEIWDRLRGTHDSSNHPSSSADESGGRAGISRIVMLAEALFEVLDQIHQQPMSLSLSMVSLPAPESVVDSFPVKTYTKTHEIPECTDAVLQCYICLAEYEDGDKIRLLPCHHEYHMSCVDKWLKEIHGVCPLCRGDVREGFTEDSTSN